MSEQLPLSDGHSDRLPPEDSVKLELKRLLEAIERRNKLLARIDAADAEGRA
jgi:hypothetical protein